MVASSWALNNLSVNDEILVSEAEHHANLIPWQIVSEKTGAKLKIFKVADNGDFILDEFQKCLNPRVKFVAITAMSNVLGTVYPVKEISELAHKKGAKVLVDACQYAVHKPINVQQIDCDFLSFSGHKLYGPTGIGVLYGKKDILDHMPPYQTGGDMVEHVSYEKATFSPSPARFEAGTPAIVQAIGLGVAIEYISRLGFDNIEKHEQDLVTYFINRAKQTPQLRLLSQNPDQGGVFAFDFAHIHPQDLSFILAHEGIAFRVGHHCAEPFVNRLGFSSLPRVSFGLYTSKEDIDTFFAALEKARHFF